MDSKLEKALVVEGIVTKPKQADFAISDRFVIANRRQERITDLLQDLKGPADFLRILTSGNADFYWRNMTRYHEGDKTFIQDMEPIIGTVVVIYQDEDVQAFQIRPAAYPCTVTYWASRRRTLENIETEVERIKARPKM